MRVKYNKNFTMTNLRYHVGISFISALLLANFSLLLSACNEPTKKNVNQPADSIGKRVVDSNATAQEDVAQHFYLQYKLLGSDLAAAVSPTAEPKFKQIIFTPKRDPDGSNFRISLKAKAVRNNGSVITDQLLSETGSPKELGRLIIRTSDGNNYRFDRVKPQQLRYLENLIAQNAGMYFLFEPERGEILSSDPAVQGHLCYRIVPYGGSGTPLDTTQLHWDKIKFFFGLLELNPRPPGGDPEAH